MANAAFTADQELDCKPLQCPMPVVRISQALRGMEPGQTLAVEAQDPAFGADIQAWIQATGHELIEFKDGDVQYALIRKAAN